MSRIRLMLSIVGLVLALIGVLRDHRALIWAAIGCIGLSIALRMIASARQPPSPDRR